MAKIDASWLQEAPAPTLRRVLVEYWHLVRRFPQWLALTIGNADNEVVRRALLPNLMDETGLGQDPSHLFLLESLLASCGVPDPRGHTPSPDTVHLEGWFVAVFAGPDTFASLCLLGPATEAISQQFLAPLETGVTTAFERPDLRYFDVHRDKAECVHAQQIEDAVQHLATQPAYSERAAAERSRWTEAGMAAHAQFWQALRPGPGRTGN